MRRGVRDLVAADSDRDEERKSGVGEAERVRRRMEGQRARREERRKVEVWVREVVVGRAWL